MTADETRSSCIGLNILLVCRLIFNRTVHGYKLLYSRVCVLFSDFECNYGAKIIAASMHIARQSLLKSTFLTQYSHLGHRQTAC